MTPAEAIARGRVIAGDALGQPRTDLDIYDPASVSADVLGRVVQAVDAGEIPPNVSTVVVRGAAYHMALIVGRLVAAADEIEAADRPVSRFRALSARIFRFMTPRRSRIFAEVSVSLGLAAMTVDTFLHGHPWLCAFMAFVACINMLGAWLDIRRTEAS